MFLNRVSQVRILLGALSTSTNYSPHLQIRALSDLGHLTADARFWRLFSAAYCTLVARAVIMKSMRTSGPSAVPARQAEDRAARSEQAVTNTWIRPNV